MIDLKAFGDLLILPIGWCGIGSFTKICVRLMICYQPVKRRWVKRYIKELRYLL